MNEVMLCPGCRTVLERDVEDCIWCGMELRDVKVTREELEDFSDGRDEVEIVNG